MLKCIWRWINFKTEILVTCVRKSMPLSSVCCMYLLKWGLSEARWDHHSNRSLGTSDRLQKQALGKRTIQSFTLQALDQWRTPVYWYFTSGVNSYASVSHNYLNPITLVYNVRDENSPTDILTIPFTDEAGDAVCPHCSHVPRP
jgi:hypothetical protein